MQKYLFMHATRTSQYTSKFIESKNMIVISTDRNDTS